MSRGRYQHPLSGRSALPVATCVLAVLAATEPRAEEPASGLRPALQAGTHMGYSRLSMTLDIEAPRGGGEYGPRTVARPGVSLRYGGFGVDFVPPRAGTSWMEPGEFAAELSDFRTHWHAARWGVEVHHRRASGVESIDTPRDHPVDPDGMTLRSSGATLYFTIDPDSRVYRLSEGLERPGGDINVFVTLAVSHAGLRADTPLVNRPGSPFDGMRRFDATGAAAGAGYALNSHVHGWYLDHALFAGYGPQWRVIDGRASVASLVTVNLRARTGVRGRYFDTGVGFDNAAHVSREGREGVTIHALTARAYLEVFL